MSAQSGLSIGQLASRTGCTAEAIRYYEREGIVPKAVRRGNGRYRSYNDADVERLAFLHRARELGFSLAEVRELITLADGDPNHSCSTVDAIAKAHLVRVESKLQQLSALRDELSRTIRACEGGLSVSDCRILGALSERNAAAETE
jgi:DNA-binding transcriptional MerR regulator